MAKTVDCTVLLYCSTFITIHEFTFQYVQATADTEGYTSFIILS